MKPRLRPSLSLALVLLSAAWAVSSCQKEGETATATDSPSPPPSAAAPGPLRAVETEETITISRGGVPVLVYHKADVPPPEGVDPVFTRSGFIHPLHAPSGGVVTGIHPEDHYHHLGLWHAWVHGEFRGKEVDFWNLKAKTGRVRFVKTLAVANAADGGAAGFTVEQEQVAFPGTAEETVVLREKFTIAARFDDGANVIDYTVAQTNVTDAPLVLPAYRYGGGIAYRAPHTWDKDNSDYLTSEGLDRTNSHTTRARWVAMHGPTESGEATVTLLCDPQNHDAPQHVRTWDNGKVFFNYVPIQETGWEIAPGATETLRYRLVIADEVAGKAANEARWEAFATGN
ncbi:MAG: PmoA family protein [Verrucomicrobiae bacterium]|nr:PmoA family protein [Verrucomicrobiae bacterium]